MTNYSAFHWSEKARKHAESSSEKADESKQWAIGEPTEPEGGSAKYWAGVAHEDQIQADWSQQDSTQVDYIKNKPSIINSVSSTSTTDALSANMGKEIQDQITNLKARGRYLSVWNSVTGLAMTTPVSPLPYDYRAGDYFIVGTVGATNYKPNGSQYTGTASTTVETGTVNVNDTYYYDGSSWSLLSGGGQVTATFSSLGGSPYDNTNLSTALNGKQPTLPTGTTGHYLQKTANGVQWSAVDALPSQTGQSGKFLKTNGTTASWSVPKTFNILDFKWSDHELNDQSWLNADTFSWQSGTVYSEAYNHLVADLVDATASIETVGSYSITVYTATDGHKIVLDDMEQTVINIFNESGVAWYYIIDTTNTRFKLPRVNQNKELLETTAPVIFGNSTTTNIGIGDSSKLTSSVGKPVSIGYGLSSGIGAGTAAYSDPNGTSTANPLLTDLSSATGIYKCHKYLYFYVGQFSQSATEQTAGLNSEMFNQKADKDEVWTPATSTQTQKETIVGWGMPDYSRTVSVSTGTSVQSVNVPSELRVFYTNRNEESSFSRIFISKCDSAGNVTLSGIICCRSGYEGAPSTDGVFLEAGSYFKVETWTGVSATLRLTPLKGV